MKVIIKIYRSINEKKMFSGNEQVLLDVSVIFSFTCVERYIILRKSMVRFQLM